MFHRTLVLPLATLSAALGLAAPAAEPAEVFADCEGCPAMVVVPAGTAVLGSHEDTVDRQAQEGAKRTVTVAYPLAVARTEVTRAQWAEFVAATGYDTEPGCQYYDGHYGIVDEHDWRRPGFAQRANHPVVCVSYDDAEAYATWLARRTGRAYRLPSSTEFEYFNRAGSSLAWFWGTDSTTACRHANVADRRLAWDYPERAIHNCDDGYRKTAPVGSFAPNAFGLNDTTGNVWEWTSDCFHADLADIPLDGRAWLAEDGGDCSLRTPRGGSWISGPAWSRAATQSRDGRGYRSFLLGFRVVARLETTDEP
jgi:formylglycine-generating enzyme required for sulfatase activity